MPIFVRQLIEVDRKIVKISTSTTLAEARLIMDEYDYSQLPVIDADERLAGMVTNESILRALIHFEVTLDLITVKDAMTPARPFDIDGDLFELLGRFAKEYAIVVSEGEKIVGVLTAFDISEYFRQRIEDDILLEDIERDISDYVLAAFPERTDHDTDEDLKAAISKAISPDQGLKAFTTAVRAFHTPEMDDSSFKQKVNESYEVFIGRSYRNKRFEDLTFFELTSMLVSSDRWGKYAEVIRMEREALLKMLHAVRAIRNKTAHYRGSVTRSEHLRLVDCRNWLAAYKEDVRRIFQPNALISPDQSTASISDTLSSESSPPYEVADIDVSGKYSGLSFWLRQQPRDRDYVWVSFKRVEELIQASLPFSALNYRAWWSNSRKSMPHSRYWLDVGFEVDTIDKTEGLIRFRRIDHKPFSDVSGMIQTLIEARRNAAQTLDEQIEKIDPQDQSD